MVWGHIFFFLPTSTVKHSLFSFPTESHTKKTCVRKEKKEGGGGLIYIVVQIKKCGETSSQSHPSDYFSSK